MADEAVQNSEQAAPKRGRMGVMIALVAASVIGAGGGVALVGPAVAHRLSAPAGEEKGGHGKDDGHGGGGGHGEAGEGQSFTVENLVLNPAETKGTRFLMATVVASMDSEGAAAGLKAREPEVRDRLMAVLGSKTVDQLSDVALRESLKAEIVAALEQIAEPAKVEAVYLPTFVIQ